MLSVGKSQKLQSDGPFRQRTKRMPKPWDHIDTSDAGNRYNISRQANTSFFRMASQWGVAVVWAWGRVFLSISSNGYRQKHRIRRYRRQESDRNHRFYPLAMRKDTGITVSIFPQTGKREETTFFPHIRRRSKPRIP